MNTNDRDTIIDVTDWEVVDDSEVPVVDQDEEPIRGPYVQTWSREVHTSSNGGCCCSLTLAGMLAVVLALIGIVILVWMIISLLQWMF